MWGWVSQTNSPLFVPTKLQHPQAPGLTAQAETSSWLQKPFFFLKLETPKKHSCRQRYLHCWWPLPGLFVPKRVSTSPLLFPFIFELEVQTSAVPATFHYREKQTGCQVPANNFVSFLLVAWDFFRGSSSPWHWEGNQSNPGLSLRGLFKEVC